MPRVPGVDLDIFVSQDPLGLDGGDNVFFQFHVGADTEHNQGLAVLQRDRFDTTHFDAGDLDR